MPGTGLRAGVAKLSSPPFLPGGAWSPGSRQTGKREILSVGKGCSQRVERQRGSWHRFHPRAGDAGNEGWPGDPNDVSRILASSQMVGLAAPSELIEPNT